MASGLALVTLAAASPESLAQDTPDLTSAIEEIVVTGTTAVGRTKLESSVAITTAGEQQIAQEAPLGTADLLELVPGFWVEDSGGEISNNVAPRGLGGGSAFRFISIQEDGLPVVYDGEQLDSLMRQDITIERMEAIRGGTAGILTVNGPASIVNFITKTGTEDPGGTFKFTTTDFGTVRGDFFYGAPFSDDWLIGVGGYYRKSDGIRDVGFTADHGGQLRVNLTRPMDDGELTLHFKSVDDSNTFYLPIALTDPDDPRGIPGLDPNEGTLLGPDVANFRHLTPTGELNTNLRDGFHTQATTVGLSFVKDLNSDWTMSVKSRFTDFNIDINAVFNVDNGSLRFATERLEDDDVAQLVADTGGVAARYQYVDDGSVPADLDGLNGNGLVTNAVALFRNRETTQFTSDLRFNYSTLNNDLAFGVLIVDYQLGQDKQIGSTYMTDVRNNPRRLDIVSIDDGGNVLGSLTDNGILEYGTWFGNNRGNLTSYSFYVNDEFQVTDNLRVDAGLRIEEVSFDVSTEQAQTQALVGNDTDNTPANDVIRNWGTGNFDNASESWNELSWTIGGNYTLTDNFAVYARYADSYQTPGLGSIGQLGEGISDLTFAEFGGRILSDTLTISATAFFTEFDNLPFTAFGGTVNERRIAISTEALGVEFDGTWQPNDLFSLQFVGVIQETEIQGIPAGDENEDFNGNQVQRTPETQIRVTPTLHTDFGNFFFTYHYLGERFADIGNTIPLPEYETIDVGFNYYFSDALALQLKGTNLSDEVGLTEGNPRAGFREATGENIYYARPILGRSYTLSITYDF